jgi:hypothetical protein
MFFVCPRCNKLYLLPRHKCKKCLFFVHGSFYSFRTNKYIVNVNSMGDNQTFIYSIVNGECVWIIQYCWSAKTTDEDIEKLLILQ